MSLEPVPGMRSTVSDGPEGLTIVMPPRRMLPVMVFLPIWLAGWAFGEVFVIHTLVSGTAGPEAGFLAVWLTAWTLGGTTAALIWSWMMFGHERLVVGSGRFVHSYELFGLSRPREYDVQAIKNLRTGLSILAGSPYGASMRTYGFGSGVICFDYGAKTVNMGAGLDEAEGRMIVQRIRERGGIPDSGFSTP
jgi:hypothetical protein